MDTSAIEIRVGLSKQSITSPDLSRHLPEDLPSLDDHQRALPAIAKDSRLMGLIEDAIQQVPTNHRVVWGDARAMKLAPESIHLVVTSPPYWTLKQYRDSTGQLGHIEDYEGFLLELDRVWQQCLDALVPGGRLICVVGDVCLSRRRNNGRHTVVPLHASIQEHCRRMGFDNLAPIIWHKIANASYEVEGNGSSFLGKPYEPNAIIKNDIEYILMQRKPGGYRSPSVAARVLSLIGDDNHKEWFQQVWTGIAGASTRRHPAPFPLQLAERLIRMFSFAGDTVLDPFAGTGTTALAAIQSGRNSISYEVDQTYVAQGQQRIRDSLGMFSAAQVVFHDET